MKIPLIVMSMTMLPLAVKFCVVPNLAMFATCSCERRIVLKSSHSTGLEPLSFPLPAREGRDHWGRTVYEITDVGVNPSRYPGLLTSGLRRDGILCRHETLRSSRRDSTARLATRRAPREIPVLMDDIAYHTFFMPFWDELVLRTRLDPGARAGTWQLAESFTVASIEEAVVALRNRHPAACDLRDEAPGVAPKSASARALGRPATTLRLNLSHVAANGRFVWVLRAYDSDDKWSWQARDLPVGGGGVWACDLDNDGSDEIVTVTWVDRGELVTQVRRQSRP